MDSPISKFLIVMASILTISYCDEYYIERHLPRRFVARKYSSRPRLSFVAEGLKSSPSLQQLAESDNPLECGQTVDIYDGDQHIIQTPNYPDSAPLGTRCSWNFNLKSMVNADMMCEFFDAPCRSRNFVFLRVNRRWRMMCTRSRKINQRIRFRTRRNDYKITITFVARNAPTGKLSCTITGIGGTSRPGPDPGETTTTPAPGGEPTASPTTPQECGQRIVSPKIVNGEEADPNEYPWMVYLVLGRGACGGTLITNQWILTAAHCSSGTNVNRIKAFLGCHSLKASSCSGSSIARNVVHKQYNPNNLRNDIALLKLAEPVQFSQSVQPVCLPTANVRGDGYKMITTGWGRTSTSGRGSDTLKEATVQSITDASCRNHFSIPSSVLCVTAISGATCNGDSGGFLGSQRSGRFEQDGITSFGSSKGCNSGLPDGFTEVRSFLSWINSNID